MKAQWAFLKELLHDRRETGLGKQYEFGSIDSIEDYRRKVPIQTWDEIHTYMEKVWEGDHGLLFPPHDPILMYAETSGTTGKPKFIPVTEISCRNYAKTWDLCFPCVLRE